MRVAFCVSGRGSLFMASVRRSAELGIDPVALIVETRTSPAVADFAERQGIGTTRLDPADRGSFERGIGDAFRAAAPDLISLTFDRIIPSDVVAEFRGRIINVHPSLLPAFAGTRAIERLLASGARFGGATVHEVTDEVDGGPIVAQAVVPTIPGESAESYGARMYAALEPMYLDVLRWYAVGAVDHDEAGRVIVHGAAYGTMPASPTRPATSTSAR